MFKPACYCWFCLPSSTLGQMLPALRQMEWKVSFLLTESLHRTASCVHCVCVCIRARVYECLCDNSSKAFSGEETMVLLQKPKTGKGTLSCGPLKARRHVPHSTTSPVLRA